MSNQETNPPKVFISYSHDSDEHKEQVLTLSDRLRDEGIDCIIDQYYEFSTPEGWPRWTEKQIREADFVLMVCTETFCRRLMGEETPGKGRGARWEGNAIYQLLYNAGTLNNKFIPVLLGSGKPEHIPTPLQGTKYYSLTTEGVYDQLYRKLTNQPSTPKNELGLRRILPPRQRQQNFPASPSSDSEEDEDGDSSRSGEHKAKEYCDHALADYKAGHLSEALFNCNRAIEIDPNYPESYYCRGSVYEEMANIEQASADYQRAMLGGVVQAYNNMARLSIVHYKDYQAAVQQCLTGLKLTQDDGQRYFLAKNLGWARFLQQRYGEAKAHLIEAIDIETEEGSAHCLLAQVLEAQNHPEEARKAWENCLRYGSSYNPDEDNWIGMAKQRLSAGSNQ